MKYTNLSTLVSKKAKVTTLPLPPQPPADQAPAPDWDKVQYKMRYVAANYWYSNLVANNARSHNWYNYIMHFGVGTKVNKITNATPLASFGLEKLFVSNIGYSLAFSRAKKFKLIFNPVVLWPRKDRLLRRDVMELRRKHMKIFRKYRHRRLLSRPKFPLFAGFRRFRNSVPILLAFPSHVIKTVRLNPSPAKAQHKFFSRRKFKWKKNRPRWRRRKRSLKMRAKLKLSKWHEVAYPV